MPRRSYWQRITATGRGPVVLSPPRLVFRPSAMPIEVVADASPMIAPRGPAGRPALDPRSPSDRIPSPPPRPAGPAWDHPAEDPGEPTPEPVIPGALRPPAPQPSRATSERLAAPSSLDDHPRTPETSAAKPIPAPPAAMPTVPPSTVPPPAKIPPARPEPLAIAPVHVPRAAAPTAPPASTSEPTHAEAPPSMPVPERIPDARTIVTTAPPALPAEAIRVEAPRLPSDPTPRAVASPRSMIPEPIPSDPLADGARARPAEASTGQRSRGRRIDEPEGAAARGNTEVRDRSRALEPAVAPIRLEPPPAVPPPRSRPRDGGEAGHRPTGVRIGSLEVRIVSPDPAKGPAIRPAVAAPSPPRAVASSTRLSRGFGAFGLVQG